MPVAERVRVVVPLAGIGHLGVGQQRRLQCSPDVFRSRAAGRRDQRGVPVAVPGVPGKTGQDTSLLIDVSDLRLGHCGEPFATGVDPQSTACRLQAHHVGRMVGEPDPSPRLRHTAEQNVECLVKR